jgi:ribosomal protein S18 acetylase RimI-like enzyme
MPVLRPMSETEYATWSELSIKDYAAAKIESGEWAESESLALARKENSELLPLGLHTADNHFFMITNAEAQAVGVFWYAVRHKFNAPIAYVYSVEVWPEHQRQGHASRTFLALEEEVRSRGLSGIALHVFGHNKTAQALYAKLGYQPTNINLFKPVPAAAV